MVSTFRAYYNHSNPLDYNYSHSLDTLVFAPNSELLASGSDHGLESPRLRLWDVLAGCIGSSLGGHTGDILTIVFSRDSQSIASGSSDQKVRLWNTQTGKHLLTIPSLSSEPRIEFLAGVDAIFVDGICHEIGSNKMTNTEIANHSRLLSDLQVDSSGEWVTKGSKRVLWLPPERQAGRYAVFGEKTVIGSWNGRMTFLSFEDEQGRQSIDEP